MKNYEKRILVTGGSGFIGSAFLRLFVPRYPNWFFINLDALTYAGDNSKLETILGSDNYKFIHGDINNVHLVEQLFNQFEINYLINFAAESHVDNSIEQPLIFAETNIMGTLNLLNSAYKKWSVNNVVFKRFIQISTDEVYGSLNKNESSFIETSGIFPNSPYSATKASSELIARAFYVTYGFPVIITRSSNNYGPYQNTEKLIPKVITSFLRGLNAQLYGDGENIRDWLFVDDNCEAIMKILIEGEVGEVYNIGGDSEMTNNLLVQHISQYMGKTGKFVDYVGDRPGHDFRYSLNSDKLKNLKWSPRKSLEEGLIDTIEFYRKNFQDE